MDIIIACIFGLSCIISGVICLAAATDINKPGIKESAKAVLMIMGTVLCVSVAIITWDVMAMKRHEETTTAIVKYYPIEVKYNTPYFFGPNNKIHELTGNSRFVDVNKFLIKWTVIPGNWKYGIYVTESGHYEIAPKDPIEALRLFPEGKPSYE